MYDWGRVLGLQPESCLCALNVQFHVLITCTRSRCSDPDSYIRYDYDTADVVRNRLGSEMFAEQVNICTMKVWVMRCEKGEACVGSKDKAIPVGTSTAMMTFSSLCAHI